MTTYNQNVIKHKVGLLNLAEELENISKACKMMGYSRDTFYRYQAAKKEGGVEASAIEITVKDNLFTISGERKASDLPESAVWSRRERNYGKFRHPVQLPFQVNENNVEARFENRVLCIVVGRSEKDKPQKIEVKAA